MVDVSLGIIQLKVVRHPHQVQKLPDVEKPVLGGVDGKGDVLANHGSERLAHELDAIVPVAETHSQFPHHVLQRINVGPIFLWSSSDWDGEGVCWIISL